MNEQTKKDIDKAFKALEERDELLDKIRAKIEPKCDRIYNLISVFPYAERRDIQELLCEIMDLCDAESEHKRMIDADELLKRIAGKCKTPSLSKDTINGLCGATAIIYDMLSESGQEKDADKESD